MPQFIVKAKRLNRRSAVPEFLPDPNNIVGFVNQNFTFEGEEVIDVPNPALGKWYKDKVGHFYWGGAVMETGALGLVSPTPARPQDLSEVTVKNLLFSKLEIDKIWAEGETGDRATVAILDSGISLNCTDLTGAVASGITGGFSSASNRMKNFVQGSDSMEDDKGHGSHCGGLIASRNFQHGVGIAKGCKLYVGKITDALNTPSVSNMINGIRWAAGLESGSPQDIDIISMSCGSLLNIPDMKPTIDAAITKGKILVFAIGNRDADSLPQGGNFPALFDGVVSVGAVDFDNNFQTYSYQSSNLMIACPGSNIMSYWIGGDTHIETGTSQSAAICAGVIALLVSRLKKRGATDIAKRVNQLLLTSPTKTINDYRYRCMAPFQLYKSI